MTNFERIRKLSKEGKLPELPKNLRAMMDNNWLDSEETPDSVFLLLDKNPSPRVEPKTSIVDKIKNLWDWLTDLDTIVGPMSFWLIYTGFFFGLYYVIGRIF